MMFKFLIDTFSWFKLIHLEKNGWPGIMIRILDNNSTFLTHEVKSELEYRHLDEYDYLKKVTLLPVIDINFHKYNLEGFDDADASLITYNIRNNLPVVTEDHPMLALGIVDQLDFIQLSDLFKIMNRLGHFTNNEFHKLIRELRKMKNITKKKHKELLNQL